MLIAIVSINRPFVGHRAARGSAVRLIVWLSPLCALGIAVSGGLDFMIRMRWFAAHRMSGVNGIPLYSALLAIAVIGLLLSLYQLRTLHDAAAHRTEG